MENDKNKKLLIVDDEEEICEFLREFFETRMSFKIFTAGTPKEAIRLLGTEKPDGMLLDINLKADKGGLDVLERVREISPATKVVMVTAVDEVRTIERARALGAVDYITKPLTLEYLEASVKSKIQNLL